MADRLFQTGFVAVIGAGLGYLGGMLVIVILRYSADLFFATSALLADADPGTSQQLRDFWRSPSGQLAFYIGPLLGAGYFLKKEWPRIWRARETGSDEE